MGNFDFSAFYRRLEDLKKLQIPAADISWIERHRAPVRACETVLYLGCNILRTPHIAKQVVDVFTHLELDFAAVGGAQFCCGIVRDKFDGPAMGGRVSRRSVARLEDYQPKQVVMWCPSCNVHFRDIVIGRDHRQPKFAITHTTQFLAEKAARGELPWTREVPCRVALHTHVGIVGHEEGARRARSDRECSAALLRSIPGVELVEEVEAPPELDYDCGAASLRVAPERFEVLRSQLLQPLRRAATADTLVTISHACHREWCQLSDGALRVRNYISIVAEALGLPTESDRLGSYKRSDDLEEILDRSKAAWSSHGLDREQARVLASKYFAGGKMAP